MRGIFIALLCAAAAAHAAAASLPKRYSGLAAAEREFAAQGLRDGVQKSFLAHFADAAIVLKPFATPALDWYRTHADGPGKLIWAPQYLAVSAAGDLGLSIGPWRYEGERDGKAVRAHGHFFSIWQRGAGGRWQVVLDYGTGHPGGTVAVEDTALVALPVSADGKAPTGAAATARRRQLEAADEALRAKLAQGASDAYATVARSDTLWVREGLQPSRGSAPPPAAAGSKPACGCGPRVRLAVAPGGDFAYSVGGSEAERGNGIDVRVWRFDPRGGWGLLADLAAAVD